MSDFPEITTDQIVTRLRMIVAEPDSLCKTDFHYIEDAADEIELLRSTVTDRNIEIEQLRKERDETTASLDALLLIQGAQAHGFDCFKEDGK